MYDSDNKKSNAQKLAETLKRCGLASSVSQAHQMAGDITSTEQKVQTFFDKKRKEMKDDLMKSVHPNREEFQSAKANDVVSAQIQTYREDNAKQMTDCTQNLQTIKIQAKSETLNLSQTTVDSPKIEIVHDSLPESAKPEPRIEIIQEDIPKNEDITKAKEPLNELCKEEIGEKEDYINKYLTKPEEKEMPSEEIKSWPPAVEKEEVKLEVKPIEVAPKPYTLPPQRPQASQVMGPHPKTWQANGIDIHNFFNFQKKGKI